MVVSSALRSRNRTENQATFSLKQLPTSRRLEELRPSLLSLKKRSTLFNKLDELQQLAVLHSASLGGSALFFEQGTGKTWITVGLIEYTDAHDVLLVVPLSNIETTWQKTINAQIPGWTVCRTWEEFKAATGRRILLVHYEALPGRRKRKNKTKSKGLIDKALTIDWDLVVFDESQRLKKRSTSSSRIARRLRYAARRVILSGTPMDASPIDIWGQMRFCEPDALGETWKEFGNVYLEKGGWANKQWLFREDMLEDFIAAIAPYALRVEKADVLTTAKPKETVIHVDLFGAQRRVYEEMDQKMVTRIFGQRTKAELVITRNVKLQQITGGLLINDNDETVRVGNAKGSRLRALVRTLSRDHPGEPVVIFCKYREEMQIIREALPKGSRIDELSGKVKDKPRDKARTRVQEKFQSGETDYLICQIKTGGVGIDLYRSHLAIFFSMGHSWIDYDQALSRLDRRGQTERVLIFLIFVRESIDDDIWEAVCSKRSLNQVVWERLKERNRRKTQWVRKTARLLPRTQEPKRSGHPPRTSASSTVSRISRTSSASNPPRRASSSATRASRKTGPSTAGTRRPSSTR